MFPDNFQRHTIKFGFNPFHKHFIGYTLRRVTPKYKEFHLETYGESSLTTASKAVELRDLSLRRSEAKNNFPVNW